MAAGAASADTAVDRPRLAYQANLLSYFFLFFSSLQQRELSVRDKLTYDRELLNFADFSFGRAARSIRAQTTTEQLTGYQSNWRH